MVTLTVIGRRAGGAQRIAAVLIADTHRTWTCRLTEVRIVGSVAEKREHEATGEHPAEPAQLAVPAEPVARAAPWLGSEASGLD